ncbi:collagen alpha-1(I) chain-like [Canis lupus familiaris]|uniref:collagen alpha-1(I) chain-like n=1 Tax=Canis lupus familiaris TaxID=9615 RepID=UPI0018F7D8F6|nr:collagen alpha-1(I) chain-like [Canis lupus familiaris]
MASGMAWGPCGYLGLVVGYLKVKSCFAEHGALGWRRLCSKPAGPRRCRSRALNCTPRGTPTRSLPKGGVSAACCVLVTGTKPPHKPPEPHAAALALEPLPGTRDALSANRGSATPAHGPPSTRSEWNLHRGRETAAHRTRSGGNVEGPAWGRAAGHRAGRRGHLRRPARTGTDTRAHRVWASGRASSGELRAPGRFPRTGREDGPGTPRALGEGGTARGHRGRRCGTATPRGARGGRRGSSGIRVRPRPQVCGDRSGPGQAHAGAGPFRRLRLAPAPRRRPGVVGAGHAASSPGGGFGGGGGGGGGGAAKGTSAALGRRGPRRALGVLRALIPATRPPSPSASAQARVSRRGHEPPDRDAEHDAAATARPTESRGRRGASRYGRLRPTCRRRRPTPPQPGTRGHAGGRTCRSRAAVLVLVLVLVGPRGPLRRGGLPRRPRAGTGGRPGGRPEADGAAGRARLGLGAQVPPPAQLEAEAACSPCPPRGEAPELLRRPAGSQGSTGPPRLPCCCPGAGAGTEPRRPRGCCRRDSLKGKPASPGPGQQEAPRLPGGPPPPVAKEKPPPRSATNEKPPPRSANEKPPPRSANEKPPPSPAANEKPPPSPAANEKPPPRSANEKPPPRSANEKPPPPNEKPPPRSANEKPPPRSANEKPPPSPAANEKPPPRSANEKPPPRSVNTFRPANPPALPGKRRTQLEDFIFPLTDLCGALARGGR